MATKALNGRRLYIPFHFMVGALSIFLFQMKKVRHICPYNITHPFLLGSYFNSATIHLFFVTELVVDLLESSLGKWLITLRVFLVMMKKPQQIQQTSTWNKVRRFILMIEIVISETVFCRKTFEQINGMV